MTVQVLFADEQIVVLVEFPEFTVYNVEMLVGEVVLDEIDVLLVVERLEHGQKVGLSQLGQRDSARPRTIHCVINAGYDLKNKKKTSRKHN